MLVSIIVPAYRLEKTIKEDIENIYEVMSKTRWDFEIIVVVDGFVDGTFEEANKVKKKNVKVVGYEKNHGKGFAVIFGMIRAAGDLILFIDGGMDINPNSISMLLEHMEWYDAHIVVGSKRHPVSRTNYPLVRKFYSWAYYTLVKVLFGIKITDTQTGLKVFKREVLAAVLPRLTVKRFAFDIEMLAVAKRLGFERIYEAPVNIRWDFEVTNFDRFLFLSPQIRAMLYDTFAIFYRMHILRYYDEGVKRKWIFDKDLQMKVLTGEINDK